LTESSVPDVRAYLQLVRLPAVFTAMADIFLGFLLTHETFLPARQFVALLAASSALYLAGMAFNDVFDRRLDAKERPDRPIPSGRISITAAVTLGVSLIVVGLVCPLATIPEGASRRVAEALAHFQISELLIAAPASITIAIGLTALILAYDGFLKKNSLGPIAMGGCRFLNLMLGASCASVVWMRPQTLVAGAMGIYVAGVTWFARQEADKSSRTHLGAATVVLHAGLCGLAIVVLTQRSQADGSRLLALAALAVVTAFLDSRIVQALRDPSPRMVQWAVKGLLLSIVLLDATMVYWRTGDPALAGLTAALVVPAATLGRWIFIT
jgi:4-hydroxybenzoate polyprenyltransferase